MVVSSVSTVYLHQTLLFQLTGLENVAHILTLTNAVDGRWMNVDRITSVKSYISFTDIMTNKLPSLINLSSYTNQDTASADPSSLAVTVPPITASPPTATSVPTLSEYNISLDDSNPRISYSGKWEVIQDPLSFEGLRLRVALLFDLTSLVCPFEHDALLQPNL